GNQAYNDGNNLGQRDVAAFDPQTEQWQALPPMVEGRWYPTLLSLDDGRILAVSGKNGTDGQLNQRIEIYDPVANVWRESEHPHDPNFVGLPFYAHIFLLNDGRIFFSGGRMDDDRPQQAGFIDIRRDPVTFQPVPANEISAFRNQSSSVLLPPAQDQDVMIIGGGPVDDVTSATGSTERVSLAEPNPRYRMSMPLSLPRMHLNAVLHLAMYSPPCRFAGSRSQLANAPAASNYPTTVAVEPPQSLTLRWAHLIGNGVTTHAFDNSQRLVDLPIP